MGNQSNPEGVRIPDTLREFVGHFGGVLFIHSLTGDAPKDTEDAINKLLMLSLDARIANALLIAIEANGEFSEFLEELTTLPTVQRVIEKFHDLNNTIEEGLHV